MICSIADLLEIWTQAACYTPARRALCLLSATDGCNAEAIIALPPGERDRRLFALRGELFGQRVEGLAECASCGTQVEVGFQIADVVGHANGAVSPQPISHGDYYVHWRLPTSGELADLSEIGPPEVIRNKLIERCLLQVRRTDEQVAPEECPRPILEEISQEMSLADPLADVRFDVRCPNCEVSWVVPFDIGAFLWRELDAWAQLLMREVHHLALAYGWSERDILQMSAPRRKLYLGLLLA